MGLGLFEGYFLVGLGFRGQGLWFLSFLRIGGSLFMQYL